MCCLTLHCRHFSLCHRFLQEWFQSFSALTTENWALGSGKITNSCLAAPTKPCVIHAKLAMTLPLCLWDKWILLQLGVMPALAPCDLHLLPVCHCRALSLTLSQGEAILSQVELQTPSLHQPVRRLEDLRGQGLRLGPLLRALARPGSSFGHNAPRGGGSFGLLTDAIQVFHWVFASFTSSGSTTAGKHYYLQSDAADWWKLFSLSSLLLPATSTLGRKLCLSKEPNNKAVLF